MTTIETAIQTAMANYERQLSKVGADRKALAAEYLKNVVSFAAGVRAYEAAKTAAAVKVARGSMETAARGLGNTFIRMTQLETVDVPQLEELNRQLYEAKERLQAFILEAEGLRAMARQHNGLSLLRALSARRDQATTMRNRTALFPELYKHVWLSYVRDPARSRDAFRENLTALEDYARWVPVPAELRLRESTDQLSCAAIAEDPSSARVQLDSQEPGRRSMVASSSIQTMRVGYFWAR